MAEGQHRVVAERRGRYSVNEDRRKGERRRERDEEADLRRDLARRETGASIRQPPMRQNSTNTPIVTCGESG